MDNPHAPNTPDILRLSRAIVRGDEPAFENFYDLYSARLHRLLLVITSGDEPLVRDLHQEVMIKAARKFRVFDSDGALWAWLSQIARNTHVDYIRKSSRRAEQPLNQSFVEAITTEEINADTELFAGLNTALQSLDDDERALVEAVYVHGRGHDEIAENTSRTSKAIESKLGRVRTKIRKMILSILKNEHRSK